MNNIVLHIPHSSLKYPEVFQKVVNDNKGIIDKFNFQMCDLYTDELFSNVFCKKLIFEYSRVFCDVEKFVDDDKEIMSKFGMGYVYTHTNLGQKFFEPNTEYKKTIYENYYKPFHQKLDDVITKSINENPTILVDCHSFCEEIIMKKDKKSDLPDICLGVDDLYKNENLINYIYNYFEKCGYKVKKNYPYCGTMIPDICMTKNYNNLNCIMIELNRNIYLQKDFSKNENFNKLKYQISNLLQELMKLEL